MRITTKKTESLGIMVEISDYKLSYGDSVILFTEEKSLAEVVTDFVEHEREEIKLALEQLKDIEKMSEEL